MAAKCPKCQFDNPTDTRFCGNCGRPLTAKPEVSPGPTETFRLSLKELASGSSFAGRYQVIEDLGKGGMGNVYKVFDKETEEKIALKLIRPDIATDEGMIRRFRNELKMARQIVHKNVCRMYDLGVAEGSYFITMEYVSGEDLKSFIRRSGQLTVGKAISIAGQICEGLAEAHRLGIVHRDLKPQNIMIDREGNTKIMDFGIARTLRAEGTTEAGAIIGTPEYMSPEQVDGKDVAQGADIYALGIILYEMLTGGVPFSGDTPLSVAYKHKNEIPKNPRDLNAQIPQDLSRIILRCLEKDKEKRFGSAEALSLELAGIGGALTTTKKEIPAVKPQAMAKKSRRLPLIGAAVILVAIVVAAYFIISRTKPQREPPKEAFPSPGWKNWVAVMPFKDFSLQKDQESFCNGMTDAIIVRLAQFQELKVTNTTSVMRYRETEKGLKQIAQELGVIHIVEGTVQKEGNRYRISTQLINPETNFTLWSNSYDKDLEALFDVQDEISVELAKALKIRLGPETAEGAGREKPKNMEAYEYFMKGMHFIKSEYVISFKEEDFQAGVEMFNKAIEIDHDYAEAHFGLAWAYEHHYHATQNDEDAKKMQQNAERALMLDPYSAIANSTMGYVYYEYRGEQEKAFELLRKGLELNPNIGETNFLIGICYLYLGLYERGIPYLIKAIDLDPYYFWTPYKLAYCYMHSGEYEKGATYFEKYFELAPIEPLIFPGQYVCLNIWMKKLEKAEELLARGEATQPDAVWVKKYRAILAALKGEKDQALALYKNSEVYSLLGMKDEAFAELGKEIRGSLSYPYLFYQDLLHNPFYNNLHSDPRFQKLVEREKKLYDEAVKKHGAL